MCALKNDESETRYNHIDIDLFMNIVNPEGDIGVVFLPTMPIGTDHLLDSLFHSVE